VDPTTLALIPILVATVLVARANASKTSKRLRRKLEKEFALAAEEMGLRFYVDTVGDQLVLRGVREGIEVEGRVPLNGTAAGWVSARPEGLNPEIQLMDGVGRSQLHGEGTGLGAMNFPADIKIGDPHFDALLVLAGPRSELYAALTHSARAAVVTLLAHDGFVLKDGQLQIALTDRDGNWMMRNFTSLLRTAQHFVFVEGRAARLLSNYRSERNPTIALRNGACLLGEYAGSPEAAEVTELLLDEGPQRFVASKGSPEWRGLLANLLVRRPKRAAPLVDDLLTLAQDIGPDWPELAAIAMTLRSLPPAVARPLLWKILESDLPDSVRIVAAMSMGRVGEVEDVQRLRDLPTSAFARIRETVDRAVELIQGRIEGAVGGGLALVEGAEEDGRLSIASTEGGLSEPGGDNPS
jgi:hypothetical protein